MNDFANNLKKAMEDANVNATELSEKTGLSKSTISRYLSGGYIAKQRSLYKLSRALNVSPAALFPDAVNNDSSNSDKVYEIKILGKVVAGIPMEAIEDITGTVRITNPDAANGHYYGLRVVGSSMEPEMHEGDLLIIHEQDYFDSGDICIVYVDGHDATVKKVQKSKAGITLIGYNTVVYPPHFYSAQEVESLPVRVVGKVVEVRRKY